jgi:hypothetical protein
MTDGVSTHRYRFDGFRYLSPGHDPAWRRVVGRVIDLRNIGWDMGVHALERVAGYRRGDRLDFHLRASTRDLLSDKRKAVRVEVEALAEAVMRAGHYPAREEAARALGAVMDVIREQVPPDVAARLSEHLPVSEVARLRRSIAHRLPRDDGGPPLSEGVSLSPPPGAADAPPGE